jgi:hypothetical protein
MVGWSRWRREIARIPWGAEELVLTEHHPEDPPQPLLVDQRDQAAALGVGSGGIGQQRRDV